MTSDIFSLIRKVHLHICVASSLFSRMKHIVALAADPCVFSRGPTRTYLTSSSHSGLRLTVSNVDPFPDNLRTLRHVLFRESPPPNGGTFLQKHES